MIVLEPNDKAALALGTSASSDLADLPPAYEEMNTMHTQNSNIILQPPSEVNMATGSPSTSGIISLPEDDRSEGWISSQPGNTFLEEQPQKCPMKLPTWLTNLTISSERKLHPCLDRPIALPADSILPKFGSVMIRSKTHYLADSFPLIFPSQALEKHDITSDDWWRFLAELGDIGGLSKAQAMAVGTAVYLLVRYKPGTVMKKLQQHSRDSYIHVIEAFMETWNKNFFNPRQVIVSLSAEGSPSGSVPSPASEPIAALPADFEARSALDIPSQNSPNSGTIHVCLAHAHPNRCNPNCFREASETLQSISQPEVLPTGREPVLKNSIRNKSKKGRYLLTVECL